MYILINTKNLIISGKFFISMFNFFLLFINLSDIIDNYANPLDLLILFHISHYLIYKDLQKIIA